MSGYKHIYIYDMRSGDTRAVTQGNFDVQSYLGVDEEEGRVYYLAREESPLTNHLYSVNLDGSGKTRLTSGQGTHSPSFSKGFRYFINRFSTARALRFTVYTNLTAAW